MPYTGSQLRCTKTFCQAVSSKPKTETALLTSCSVRYSGVPAGHNDAVRMGSTAAGLSLLMTGSKSHQHPLAPLVRQSPVLEKPVDACRSHLHARICRISHARRYGVRIYTSHYDPTSSLFQHLLQQNILHLRISRQTHSFPQLLFLGVQGRLLGFYQRSR